MAFGKSNDTEMFNVQPLIISLLSFNNIQYTVENTLVYIHSISLALITYGLSF